MIIDAHQMFQFLIGKVERRGFEAQEHCAGEFQFLIGKVERKHITKQSVKITSFNSL